MVLPVPVPPVTRKAQPGRRRSPPAGTAPSSAALPPPPARPACTPRPRGTRSDSTVPGPRDRGEHRVEAGAVGQPHVGVRGRVVEPPAGRGRPAAGRAGAPPRRRGTGRRVRSSPSPRSTQTSCGAVDQDVGDAGQAQQRLERSGAEHVAPQLVVHGQHRRVAHRRARRPQRLGHPVRGEVTGRGREPSRTSSSTALGTGVADAGALMRRPAGRGRRAPAAPAAPHRPEAHGRPTPRRPRWSGTATTTGRPVTRSTSVAQPTGAHHEPGPCGRPRAATSRTVAARPGTVAGTTTQQVVTAATSSSSPVSRRRARSSTTRSWPRCGRRQDRDARWARRRGGAPRPGEHAEDGRGGARPRAATARRAARRCRPAPPTARRGRTPGPSIRSSPGPSGSASTSSVGARTAYHWARAQASVEAPAPPVPPTTPTVRPARGPLLEVGEHVDQPGRRVRQLDHRAGADRDRGTEDRRRPATSPTTCTPVAPRRRPGRQPPRRGRSPTSDEVGRAPGGQAERGSSYTSAPTPAAALSGTTARGRAADTGEEEDWHADEPPRRHRRRPPCRPPTCGRGRRGGPVDAWRPDGRRPRGRPTMADMTRPTAAFFDLDKTIIAKSSTLAFSRAFQAGGLIRRRAMLRRTYAQFVYLVGGADHDQMEKMRAVHVAAVRRAGTWPRSARSSPTRCTTSSTRSSTTRRSA